jgi:hypothetical protein
LGRIHRHSIDVRQYALARGEEEIQRDLNKMQDCYFFANASHTQSDLHCPDLMNSPV